MMWLTMDGAASGLRTGLPFQMVWLYEPMRGFTRQTYTLSGRGKELVKTKGVQENFYEAG
jgi:hypothetical protein